jgi:filamentous hemagglutinin family protein
MKKLLLLSTSLTACTFLAYAPHTALANPEGGVISSGSATIETGPTRVDVRQSSDKAVIDWRSFNINKGETTQFHQPTTSSLTVNRINDSNPSQILGNLKSNGNIVLINQSGISFGKDAVVDVGGLIATTSDISNADAMAGRMNFVATGNATATISNEGAITAKDAGLVGLVAPNVENSGVITAKLGKVHLASGDKFTLDLYGDGAISIQASDALESQLVSHTGTISAEGGIIQVSAATGAHLVNSLVQIDGELSAPSASIGDGGKIIIAGDDASSVSITGILDTSGTNGGSISISGKNVLQQGKLLANATNGQGGTINVSFKEAYLDSEASSTQAKGTSGNGGSISIKGKQGSRAFVSGTYDASSEAQRGGTVKITAAEGDLKLFGAHVSADGATGGGSVQIGGEFQGGGTLEHSKTTAVNYSTVLSADATQAGKGGEVIVWSDEETLFGGTAQARGGIYGGSGGQIEISSKETMKIAGNAVTTAAARMDGFLSGNLLLDPKNITIETGGISGGISYFEFVDPNPDNGNFGKNILILSNGNVAVADYRDNLMASRSGAVYLFNGATGALISTLTGTQANDTVGMDGFTELSNGNYLITSSDWNNGGATDAGAVTWASGTTGISGSISSANSIVGSSTEDWVGYYGVAALDNGNYLVFSPWWDNGGVTDTGAVTWGNGATGTSGEISATNSLVGSTAYDTIGYVGFSYEAYTSLTNGNVIISSPWWNNGAASDAGAVTWMNGATGTSGVISSANSLVGSSANDTVGTYDWDKHIYALPNGNYVVVSGKWDNGALPNAGAVTWGNGTTGTSGVVSAANSLVGSSANDRIGGDYGDITILSNGNYVINSPLWSNGGLINVGAVTWVDGSTTGLTGVISSANSLIGSKASDYVGIQIIALTNGNYVINSSSWDNGATTNVGAVTWVDGTTGLTGFVTTANSLYGTTSGDQLGYGGVTALSNGNYVVSSYVWDNGAILNAGAVTWADGTTGITGQVSSANSLVGSSANDRVGSEIFALSNGNYLVKSPDWDNGGTTNVGAITWVNGTTGRTGAVSSTNSLIGSSSTDFLSWATYIYEVGGGNYIVAAPNWDNGAATDAGAVIWGDGTVGVTGAITSANALVGTTSSDNVGDGILLLSNGNYVVYASLWDNGAATDAGAATWGSGTTGVSGVISSANSLVGASAFDNAGYSAFELADGNYLINTYSFDDGATTNVGAFTWGDGTTGITGVVSSGNSLVGATSGDLLSDAAVLSNGAYLIYSRTTDSGALTDVGSVTYVSAGGASGVINSTNTIFGSVSTKGLTLVMNGEDTINNKYVFSMYGAQKIYSLSTVGDGDLSDYGLYSDFSTASFSFDPTFITNVLNAGTSVTLQASNDITLNADLIVNNAGGEGGTLTLQAGRSILLNADIFTDNGDLNLFANEDLSTGVVNAQRDSGDAVITMAAGTSINAGTGNVTLRLDDGTGKAYKTAGDITLRDLTAGTILARNMNAGQDIILQSGVLTATNVGDAITLVSEQNFINNSGAGALSTPAGRWLIYTKSPTGNTLGGLIEDFSLYSCTYGGACAALAANNGLLYSSSMIHPSSPSGTPQTPTTPIPETVDYMSLGGFLRDIQNDVSIQFDQDILQSSSLIQEEAHLTDDNQMELSYTNTQVAVNAEKNLDGSYIAMHPWLKEFLSNPFAILAE